LLVVNPKHPDFSLYDRSYQKWLFPEFIDLLKQYDKVVILEEHYTFNAMSKKIIWTYI
jgi:hypothetical protein